MAISEDSDGELKKLVKESFSTEAFGVAVPKSLPKAKEEERAESILNSTTRCVGDRFETGLIWKSDVVVFPESRKLAVHRLHSTERKLAKDPKLAEAYSSKMDDYLNKGYARRHTPKEMAQDNAGIWYLPHFAVVNSKKPGNVRLVFDAAAISNGISFNSQLLQGPDLLVSLPATLVKFRRFRIGFSGDIKEMFHQIHIRENDVQAQRFLWRCSSEGEPEEFVMKSMIFGATCSSCSAQFVKNLNGEDHMDEFPEASKAIVENHYMDDWLDSVTAEAKAIKLIGEVIEVHRRGGFQICNFVCSSKEFLQNLSQELVATDPKNLCVEREMPTERVLGLWWDLNSDNFVFQLKFHKVKPELMNGHCKPTKRELLRVVMSLFDPRGLLANFTVMTKIIFQECWRAKLGRDYPIPDAMNDKWQVWLKNLTLVKSIRIPRCYSVNIPGAVSIQVHIFCDASEDAFAAAAYLRVNTGKEVQVSLMMAKTRVAPLKSLSVPKMQLQEP